MNNLDYITDITLSFYKNRSVVVRAKQYDTGTRIVRIQLLDENNEVWTIPSVVTVGVKVATPSGRQIDNACEVRDNYIYMDLTEQILAEAGKCNCEIVLVEGADERISTCTFVIKVGASVHDDSHVEATDEFTLMNKALAALSDANNIVLREELQDFFSEYVNGIKGAKNGIAPLDGYSSALSSQCPRVPVEYMYGLPIYTGVIGTIVTDTTEVSGRKFIFDIHVSDIGLNQVKPHFVCVRVPSGFCDFLDSTIIGIDDTVYAKYYSDDNIIENVFVSGLKDKKFSKLDDYIIFYYDSNHLSVVGTSATRTYSDINIQNDLRNKVDHLDKYDLLFKSIRYATRSSYSEKGDPQLELELDDTTIAFEDMGKPEIVQRPIIFVAPSNINNLTKIGVISGNRLLTPSNVYKSIMFPQGLSKGNTYIARMTITNSVAPTVYIEDFMIDTLLSDKLCFYQGKVDLYTGANGAAGGFTVDVYRRSDDGGVYSGFTPIVFENFVHVPTVNNVKIVTHRFNGVTDTVTVRAPNISGILELSPYNHAKYVLMLIDENHLRIETLKDFLNGKNKSLYGYCYDNITFNSSASCTGTGRVSKNEKLVTLELDFTSSFGADMVFGFIPAEYAPSHTIKQNIVLNNGGTGRLEIKSAPNHDGLYELAIIGYNGSGVTTTINFLR